MYTHPFFEATPPGAAPGPPVNTGARVRHFRGCNHGLMAEYGELVLSIPRRIAQMASLPSVATSLVGLSPARGGTGLSLLEEHG